MELLRTRVPSVCTTCGRSNGITLSTTLLRCLVVLLLFSVPVVMSHPIGGIQQIQSTMPVYNMTFASKLRVPCSLASDQPAASSGAVSQLTEESRIRVAAEIFEELTAKVGVLKRMAEQIAQTDMESTCSSLELSPITTLPSLQELSIMPFASALQRLYGTLAIHAAHMYYLKAQQDQYRGLCSSMRPNDNLLGQKYNFLAIHLQDMLCFIRLASDALTLQVNFHQPTAAGLNTRVSDLRECSRRIVRDCQVLGSTVEFLGILRSYLRNHMPPVKT